jgi:hypothetical protein
MKGKTKCWLHGGRTPSGQAHGAYKHGRYSKVLPVRLAERYSQAVSNPNLLSLRDDIATAEARLMDLFQRVSTRESGQLWQDLRGALDAFALAQARVDVDAMDRHCATMRQLVTQGSDDYAAWSEIYRVWEARCRLTHTEAKTLLMLEQTVSVEQLVHMFGHITDAIQRAVLAHADELCGRKILAAISADFDLIARTEAEA